MDLITGALSANQDAIEFLEKIELLIRSDLEKLNLVNILSGQELNQDFAQRLGSKMELNAPFKGNDASLMLATHGIFNSNTALQKEQPQKNKIPILDLSLDF